MTTPDGRPEPIWRRYLRLIRPDVPADVDDELAHHLELRIRDYQARGLSPNAARRAALERFGDLEAVRRWLETHDRRWIQTTYRKETLVMLLTHLRYGIRSLINRPGFTLAAILTLALGIGATTAIFGVVNAVLLRPLPYPESERLVGVWHSMSNGSAVMPTSHATYEVYRRFNRSLAGLAVHTETAVNLTDGAVAERVPADRASASLFSVLGVQPMLGRTFGPDDEQPSHASVVIISEGLWRRRFAAVPNVIGQTLRLDGVAHEIVGVMPASVRFPEAETQLWLPLTLDPADPVPIGFYLSGVGRLRPGVSIETAARELEQLLPRLPELFANGAPGMPMKAWLDVVSPKVLLHPLRDDVVGDVGRVLWVIFGTVGFVLLAACANIANLFLVRAESRQRELAVHAALGASRADVLARLLTEGILLSVAGTVLGVALAALGLSLLKQVPNLPIPRLAEVGIDGSVLGVSVLLAAGVGLLTSALPMLKVGARDLTTVLRSAGRGATTGHDRRRWQRGLVVAQVALAFVLLTACALMARSFVELRRVRLGFRSDHVLTFRVALPSAGYPDRTSVMAFYQRLTDRLAHLPGVSAAGITSWLPLTSEGRRTQTVFAEGDESPRQEARADKPHLFVSPGYFESLGIPLVAGRMFRVDAPDQGSDEIIVSRAFSRQTWGDPTGQRALGRRIQVMPTGPKLTVVGVVDDIRHESIEQPPAPAFYLPLNSDGFGGVGVAYPREVGVVVTGRSDPLGLAPDIRREVTALDPGLPLYDVAPMENVVRRSMARTSFTGLLLGVAAGVALGLGAIGLYGVVAYTVSIQTREIGVRIALGARPTAVSRLLARQGTLLAALGIGVGLLGSLAVTRALGALLYGVSPIDPVTLSGTALLLLGVAFGASWLPARRAAQVDPATVLSAE